MADPRLSTTITASAQTAISAVKQIVGLGSEAQRAADKARASAGRIREGVESISTQLDKATASMKSLAATYVSIGRARSTWPGTA